MPGTEGTSGDEAGTGGSFELSKWQRIALAAATLYMPLTIAVFVVIILIATIAGGGEPDEHLLVSEQAMTPFFIALAVVWGLLHPLYIRHAKHNTALHPERRKRWLFAIRLYGPFTMPRYWWLFIRDRGASSRPS